MGSKNSLVMRYLYSVALLLFFVPAWLQSQEDSGIAARLELREQDGQMELTGYCDNHSGRARSLSYKLSYQRIDSRNNRSSSSQGGAFELADGESLSLSTSSVNIDEESYLVATLEILEGEKTVARQSRTVGKPAVAPAPQSEAPKEGHNPPQPRPSQGQNNYGPAGDDIEMGAGFIVDETRTRAGRDFYDEFYRNWEEPLGAADYIIRIEERPSPGRSTLVTVTLNGEQIFARMLQPKPEYISELAAAVAQYTRGKTIELIQAEQGLEENDGQAGTGLY